MNVIFFGKQSQIVPQGQQALEQLLGLIPATEQYEVVDKPKAARKKNTFARQQTIDRVISVIASHESLDREILFHYLDGRAHARIVRTEKSNQGD
jgi:hypothetical protein